ncbi:MAG: M20/M25/M40 family metallo-hydrolase [Bacteroidales bacterium]
MITWEDVPDIIPGANDNASAVAVMMGVAKALYESRIPLGRSVLFIAFGSEEQGILGSKAYLENPPFDLKRSVLYKHGRRWRRQRISINSGKDFPFSTNPSEEMNSKYIHHPFTKLIFQSWKATTDGRRFLTAGIPSLSFATYGSTSYYHVPPDKYI